MRVHDVTEEKALAAPQLLIADFFFILLVLSWLAAGVGERAALGSSVRHCAMLFHHTTCILCRRCWMLGFPCGTLSFSQLLAC